MARPTKLTPEVHDIYCRAVEAGATVEMAEAQAGIGQGVSYSWLKRGNEEKSGRYAEFREAVMRARKKAGLRWLAKLQQLADDRQDWRAYAWLLERHFPEVFNAKTRVEFESGQAADPLVVELLRALQGADGGE